MMNQKNYRRKQRSKVFNTFWQLISIIFFAGQPFGKITRVMVGEIESTIFFFLKRDLVSFLAIL